MVFQKATLHGRRTGRWLDPLRRIVDEVLRQALLDDVGPEDEDVPTVGGTKRGGPLGCRRRGNGTGPLRLRPRSVGEDELGPRPAAAERAARLELKALAANLAVDSAESLLAKQLTPQAQEALVSAFVKGLAGRPN